MASVHKYKKSRFWHGSVWLPGGKRIFRSTGKTDKAEALMVALQWERTAKGPPRSEDQARRVMDDIIKAAGGVGVSKVSVKEYAQSWLRQKKGTVSPSTEAYYRQAIDGWVEWLAQRANRSVDSLQRDELIEWREHLSKRVSTGTVNQRIKAVRLMLKEAGKEFGFATTAAEVKKLRRATDDKRARRPFTREELEKLLSHCSGPWRLMVLVGLQTGQRLGDIARMRWHDLRDGNWNLSARKTGTKLRIPLTEEVLGLLESRKEGRSRATGDAKEQVFPELASKITDKGVGRVSNEFGRMLFKAGLRAQDPHDERDEKRSRVGNRRKQQELSFHSLRHTARTWLEEAGQPKAVIDAFIGHEGDTGKIYTTVGAEALRSAAQVLGHSMQKRGA